MEDPEKEKLTFVLEAENGTFEAGIEEVEELADQGNAAGLFALGYCYLFGVEKEADKGRGYDLLEKAAEKDSVDAKVLLCRMYLEGDYYALDNDKAAAYAKEGADEGLPDGLFYYGIALMDGAGVERDPAKAAEYLRKAANKGHSEARNTLACLYLTGDGVEKDEQKAYKLFTAAAKAGNVNAMFQAATCLESGTGTAKDIAKAREWYGKAAENGDPEASYRLGVIALTVDENAKEAFDNFLDSASGGVSDAMCTLGRMYLNGIGTEANREEAVRWLQLAKDSGNPDAEGDLEALGIKDKDETGDEGA